MGFDNQQLFNIVVAIGAFLGVFVFNQIMQRLTRMEDSIANMREELPKDYVHKDDYKTDMADIKSILKQIYDKLDSKADK